MRFFFKVDKVLKDGRWIDNDITGNQDGDDKTEGENKDYSEKHDFDLAPTEETAEDTVMRILLSNVIVRSLMMWLWTWSWWFSRSIRTLLLWRQQRVWFQNY